MTISKEELLQYKSQWDEMQKEIKKVCGMYITEQGMFDGLTDFVMHQIYEAEQRGLREAREAIQEQLNAESD